VKAVNSDEDEAFEALEEALPRAMVNAVEECIEHSRTQGSIGSGRYFSFCQYRARDS
jgi:ATP-dependent helicase HrpA